MHQAPILVDTSRHGCREFWDANNARLSPCALQHLVIAPATVAVLITLGHILSPLFHRWCPKWAYPFISEQDEQQDIPPEGAKQHLHWTVTLLACSALGVATEIVQLVPPGFDVPSLVLLVSGISICILIAIKRPRSCSIPLLSYFTSAFIVESTLAAHYDGPIGSKIIARSIAAVASLAGCCTIVLMPFRNPSLLTSDISNVGEAPSDKFRSPEDSLRLWQFLTVSWMSPLISLGRKRQLNEPDVWSLGFEFQHRRLHDKFRRMKGSVLTRVLKANSLDVLIISTIAIVQLFCQFSTPVLLQQLLQTMQDSRKPKRVPMTYALLWLIIRLVAAQSQVLGLWYGRRCYERSRGEMVMMVYEKALSRKNILGSQVDGKEDSIPENAQHDRDDGSVQDIELPPSKPSIWKRLTSKEPKREPAKAKAPASMGKIFNLLRGDVYEVAQRFWEVDTLIDGPVGLCLAVALVWVLFGPSCFLGILAILLGQTINAVVTRVLFQREKTRRAATDSRLQITSQFVEAIRHLRWYGWQNHWLQQVMEARQRELDLRIITSLWNIVIRFVNAFSSGVFPVIALYAYTMLAGHELRIDIIFPALMLFTMLEGRLRDLPGLITSLINAYIALGRIEDFMTEPDKQRNVNEPRIHDMNFELHSCSFAWPGKSSPVLSDIDAKIPQGLTVVTGKVGSGKTALLQGLLGELDLLSGKSHIPNEMMGYCAQTPWLQSMSIRDNILFSAPYEELRYKQTLEACALLPDLAQFKHGDLSFIGENGIGLSGGQKARVALARAVYSSSRVLLLDDPLSALDHNTAEFVVRKCLSGQLMQNRTIILVTHRTSLVQGIADQIIEISQGHAAVYDKSAISKSFNNISNGNGPLFQSSENDTEEDIDIEDHANAVPDKFIEEEHRAEWGVKARVYWTYIKAGKYRWWLTLVLILTIYRLANVGQSWFLKDWGEAYSDAPIALQGLARRRGVLFDDISLTSIKFGGYFVSHDPIKNLPSPRDDVRPWLWTFFAIASFQAIALLIAQLLMLVIVYCAGKMLFQRVMTRVSNATFRFFDVTPVGRLMNRLTSDIGVVDGNISEQFQVIAFQAITWISSILVIASAAPAFLLFSLALTTAFILIFLRFLPTSQSLRRLEMVSLTPLLSNFGELLHGLTTVRAFRAEARFQSRVISVVDKFQGMDHFYWSLQAWLISRFEALSAFSTFCLTGLALYTNTTPGLMAFVLIAANNFVDSTHQLCKQYGQLQMDFVSVERIDELLHIDEEPAGCIEPPAAWPTYGKDILFENVTMRYAPHLEPSLTDVSLRIPGGSTAAIVGRTGSGKSTLAVSLLSVIKPETGRVIIDGIDIARVSTQALRTRVTFVAQDPVLFPGSIRLNLDPTEEFSNGQCAEVLERLCGRHGWTLGTYIEAGGRNLSQGQRQLIALTRAVLRRSPIVILDEATASIDHETSLQLQHIVREELQSSTVITIAHRIEAVKDADYFVVLDQGRVARQGYTSDQLDSM